jgi:hypothetical protein
MTIAKLQTRQLESVDLTALARVTGGDASQLATARGIASANGLTEPADTSSRHPNSLRNLGRGTVFCGSPANLDNGYNALLATKPTEMGLNGHQWVKNGVQTGRPSESVDPAGFRCMHIGY